MSEFIRTEAGTGGNAAALSEMLRRSGVQLNIEFAARAAHPRRGKESVPIIEHRPRDFDDAVHPIVVRAGGGAEYVGEARAACEAQGVVSDQQLAVVALERAGECAPMRSVVKDEIDPRGSHACTIGLSQPT